MFTGEGIADVPEVPDPPHILQDPISSPGHIKTGVDVDLPAIPDAIGNQEVGMARLPLVAPVIQGQDMGFTVNVMEISGTGGNQVAAVNDVTSSISMGTARPAP